MISYSERELFCSNDVRLLKVAEKLVASINDLDFGKELRCHEVARAVGEVLELSVQDGHYLSVEHSWIWVGPPILFEKLAAQGIYPPILDVYAVGGLPQVQLFDASPILNRVGAIYKPGKERTDIREEVVTLLVLQMKAARTNGGCRKCGVPTFGRFCKNCQGVKYFG